MRIQLCRCLWRGVSMEITFQTRSQQTSIPIHWVPSYSAITEISRNWLHACALACWRSLWATIPSPWIIFCVQTVCSGISVTSRHSKIPCSDATATLQPRRQTLGLRKQHCWPEVSEAGFCLVTLWGEWILCSMPPNWQFWQERKSPYLANLW